MEVTKMDQQRRISAIRAKQYAAYENLLGSFDADDDPNGIIPTNVAHAEFEREYCWFSFSSLNTRFCFGQKKCMETNRDRRR